MTKTRKSVFDALIETFDIDFLFPELTDYEILAYREVLEKYSLNSPSLACFVNTRHFRDKLNALYLLYLEFVFERRPNTRSLEYLLGRQLRRLNASDLFFLFLKGKPNDLDLAVAALGLYNKSKEDIIEALTVYTRLITRDIKYHTAPEHDKRLDEVLYALGIHPYEATQRLFAYGDIADYELRLQAFDNLLSTQLGIPANNEFVKAVLYYHKQNLQDYVDYYAEYYKKDIHIRKFFSQLALALRLQYGDDDTFQLYHFFQGSPCDYMLFLDFYQLHGELDYNASVAAFANYITNVARLIESSYEDVCEE